MFGSVWIWQECWIQQPSSSVSVFLKTLVHWTGNEQFALWETQDTSNNLDFIITPPIAEMNTVYAVRGI
jgi:hypothetical protein